MDTEEKDLLSSSSSEEEQPQRGLDVQVLIVDAIKGVKKFWFIAVITVLIGTSLMYVRSKRHYTPMYSSSATFAISTLGASGTYSYYSSASATSSLEKAFPYIISCPVMTNIIREELGVSRINGTYSASTIEASNIFTITVKSTVPEDAYNILCAILKCYPRIADYVIGETQITYITRPEINNVPYTSDSVIKDSLKGAAIGFAFWLVLIALYAVTRNTVRTAEDISDKLGQQCIAEIPYIKRRRNEMQSLLAVNKKLSLFSEAYRTLRTRLLAYVEKNNAKVFAVTSTEEGEGKTTVAFNTAYSLAGAGKKVALVEMDFKAKSLAALLFPENPPVKGISDVASGKIALAGVFKPYKHKNFHIYCAGSASYFDPEKYTEIFEVLRQIYEFIIIDAPAGGIISGDSPVTAFADSVIYVVKQDRVTVGKIRDALENLFYSRKQIAGFVFNSVKADYKGYGGYYYGGYKYGSYKYGSYKYNSYRYGHYGYGKKYGSYGGYGNGYGYGYGYGYGGKNADLIKDESDPGELLPDRVFDDERFNAELPPEQPKADTADIPVERERK